MIHSVRADRASFRAVEFTSGLNVILAERTESSREKDSRNGLGKSTLIEIIDFCLGATGKSLQTGPLAGWTFSLEMTVGGRKLIVSWNTNTPARVTVDGDTAGLSTDSEPMLFSTRIVLSVNDWLRFLGQAMFALPSSIEGDRYRPTYRSLVSYFTRHDPDAFSSPFEHHRKQRGWDIQVNNAYLLGLAWRDAQELQLLKDERQDLDALKKAIGSDRLRDMFGSLGELQAERVKLEQRVRRQAQELEAFQVLPQYREIERRASELTRIIHENMNDNNMDQQLLNYYVATIEQESDAVAADVEQLYAAANAELPGAVVRRLEDVRQFHLPLVANRREFLGQEMDRIRRAISDRETTISRDVAERAQLFEVLRTHRALDEHTRLQNIYLEVLANLRRIEQRIANLELFEEKRAALKIREALLQDRMRRDFEERRTQRDQAIALFKSNSEALYDVSGKLVINVGPSGFTFSVDIERSGSQGIGKMKIFCYDLMLAQLWSGRAESPGFLIHDSTIFDGVDERQIAHALELVASDSQARGYQYICALNSDTVPFADFTAGFDLGSHVRLQLSDATDDGGLLGFRF